jgi:hypothetical protein
MWPTLAGLSVLIHIGLLGLAFPLLIELMPRESARDDRVTIPIELVTAQGVSVETAGTQDAAETAQPSAQTAAASPPSENSADAASSRPAHNRGETRAAVTTTTRTPTSADEAAQDGQSNQAANPDQQAARGNPNNPEATRSTQRPPANRSPTPPQATAPTRPAPASPQPRNPSPAESPDPAGATEPPQLPVSGGAPLLPPPATAAAPSRSLFVNFVNLTPVPDNIPGDRPDQYPQLQTSPSRSIVLNARDHTCGEMGSLVAQPVLVRVVISQSGRIVDAMPWPNRPGTAFEQFVACLMPQTDFLFTPARTGTQNVATDRVIVEVVIGPS